MPFREGIAVSHGIAAGSALVISSFELDVPHYRIRADEVRSELRRFWNARSQARDEIRELRDRTAQSIGKKYAAIFDAHRMILDDRQLGRETMKRIRDEQMNCEWALAKTVQRFLAAFEKVDDPYLREKGGDISDVHQRLQRLLAQHSNHQAHDLNLSEDTVVVAHSLLPSDAVWLHQDRIVAFVTEEGSKTSHTAILANALEIPAVLGVDGISSEVEFGEEVIVDGFHGRVAVSPTDEVRESMLREQAELQRIELAFEEERGPVVTRDGAELRIAGNIEFPEEMRTISRVGAHGVGLYRSEFLFLGTAPNLPTEEDHYKAYRRIVEDADGENVVIRTLDLGGEKYFHKVLAHGEANPVLGMRAVRFCLSRPDIFRTQLRGLLRVAAEFGNVWILVPMISGLGEWRRVVEFMRSVSAEIREEGLVFDDVPLGPMIEVPSAALIADDLARECDFIAIGTNDLLQYTLAVDRGNRAVSYLSDPWHPAVLRLVREVVLAGKRHGKPVSLCGEMASDPLGALTLLGLGLERFSCNPTMISEIRSLLRAATESETRDIVLEAVALGDGQATRAHIAEKLGGLVREVLGEDLAGSS